MERRKFIIGTASAAVGGSALLGTGAFSRVESQRGVSVQVAEDPDGYLGMEGCEIDGEPAPNSSYTVIDDHGHLAIEMNDENPTDPGGEGINSNSISWFDNVFQICNQGKEAVCVYIAEKGGEDPQRVTFYTGEQSGEDPIPPEARLFSGIEAGIQIPVGECECIGFQVNTKENEAFEITKPADGDVLLEEVGLVADVSDACTEEVCPELAGEYGCTTYELENGSYIRTGTRFVVTNTGPVPTEFDLAIANEPPDFREDVSIGGNTERNVISDASVPQNAVIAWDAPDGCEGELQTWGEYKDDVGVDDLSEWYTEFGTGDPPGDAPEDFDDEFVVEVKDIPEQEDDPADTIGPDEEISDELYPDMSEDAEEEGWITCSKEDENE